MKDVNLIWLLQTVVMHCLVVCSVLKAVNYQQYIPKVIDPMPQTPDFVVSCHEILNLDMGSSVVLFVKI